MDGLMDDMRVVRGGVDGTPLPHKAYNINIYVYHGSTGCLPVILVPVILAFALHDGMTLL